MKKLLCAVLLSPLLYSNAVLADDAKQLRETLNGTESLKADFKQTVTDVNKKVIQSGAGVFALAHPNQFYWHLTILIDFVIILFLKVLLFYHFFCLNQSIGNYFYKLESYY